MLEKVGELLVRVGVDGAEVVAELPHNRWLSPCVWRVCTCGTHDGELPSRDAKAPLAAGLTKKLVRERRWGEPEEVASVFRSADAIEAARAFAERRPPAWTGS